MAPIIRQKALDSYYANPNRCLNCGEIIEIGDGKVGQYRRKKFCNNSCAAIFNNKRKPKKTPKPRRAKPDKREKWDIFMTQTKGQLFDRRRNWQSARSTIRKYATLIYFEVNEERICKACGYSHYIEVCHIRPVSEFPRETLISEINDISNLVGLCPNCHWEFDHGILLLRDRVNG